VGEQIELRHELLAWRSVEDDVIVHDRIASTHFTLNPSAAVLWEHLVRGCDYETLITALVARYGLPEEEAADDVLQFVQQLTSRGLVRLHPLAGTTPRAIAARLGHLDG
jgi:hypothetical protein